MKRLATVITFLAITTTATGSFAGWNEFVDRGRQLNEAERYLKKSGIQKPTDDQIKAEVATGRYEKELTKEEQKAKAEKEANRPPTRAEATKVSCRDGVITLESEFIKGQGPFGNVWNDITETRQFLPSGILKGVDVENKLTLYVHPEVPLMIMLDGFKNLKPYIIDPDKTGTDGGTYFKNYINNKAFNEKYCASEPQTIFYKNSGVPIYRMRWYTFALAKDNNKDDVYGARDYMNDPKYKEIINRLVRSVSKDPETILEYFAKNKDKQEALDAELIAFFAKKEVIAPDLYDMNGRPIARDLRTGKPMFR